MIVLLQILIVMFGAVFIVGVLVYNVIAIDQQDRAEIAKEMRQAMRWASIKKMQRQYDYKAILRGR